MKRILFIFLAFTMATSYFSLEMSARPKKVKGVGRWVQEEHMTGEQATEYARREAKKDALRAAGIEERVWSVFGVMSSSDSHDPALFEAWSETSIVTIDAMVQIIEEKVTPEWNADKGLPVKVVTITAYVDEDQRHDDPAYRIQVEGLKDLYNDNDQLKFSFRIHGSDSYLKIFYFSSEGAGLIYPKEYQMNRVYSKNTTYHIPEEGYIDAHKPDDARTADVTFLIVATKRERAFATQPTANNIMKWLYQIPADERAVEMRKITIL